VQHYSQHESNIHTSVVPNTYRNKRQIKPPVFNAPKFTLFSAKTTVTTKKTIKQVIGTTVAIKKLSMINDVTNIQNRTSNICNATVSVGKNIIKNLSSSSCNVSIYF
jgi:hypothetical protein